MSTIFYAAGHKYKYKQDKTSSKKDVSRSLEVYQYLII